MASTVNTCHESWTGASIDLPPAEWLAALLDPTVTLRFLTYGYSRLAATWGFTNRRVSEHLVYAVVDQTLTATVGGRSWRLPAGGFCLLPPETPHTFAPADVRNPLLLQWFRLEMRRGDRTVQLAHPPLVLYSAPTLREHLDRLHDDHNSISRDTDVRIRSSLALMFSAAFRSAQAPSTSGELSYPQRRRLYELLRQSGSHHLGPVDLARAVDLSPDYFTRLFRNTFGVAPRRWLVEQRIRQAASLLADTTLTISEIADALGYSDSYQLSRQFKQIVGTSPRTYRQTRVRSG